LEYIKFTDVRYT